MKQQLLVSYAKINLFHVVGLYLFPLKASGNLRFSGVCGEYSIDRNQWHDMGKRSFNFAKTTVHR